MTMANTPQMMLEEQRETARSLRSIVDKMDAQVRSLAKMSEAEIVRWASVPQHRRNRIVGLRQIALGASQVSRGALQSAEAAAEAALVLTKAIEERDATIRSLEARVSELKNLIAN